MIATTVSTLSAAVSPTKRKMQKNMSPNAEPTWRGVGQVYVALLDVVRSEGPPHHFLLLLAVSNAVMPSVKRNQKLDHWRVNGDTN